MGIMTTIERITKNIEDNLNTLFCVKPTEKNGWISYKPREDKEARYTEGVGMSKTSVQAQMKARVARYTVEFQTTGKFTYIPKEEEL
jgi:hypothetical protein